MGAGDPVSIDPFILVNATSFFAVIGTRPPTPALPSPCRTPPWKARRPRDMAMTQMENETFGNEDLR